MITHQRGGVGSLDEALAKAMIDGGIFICLDNCRGRLDSQLLESAVRGHGMVNCRAFRKDASVSTTHFMWQLSTNGADLTKDLANRSIMTRLRKRPQGYEFRRFGESDLLAHVAANQPHYLGCVHAVIRSWVTFGMPRTDEARHDFKGWCQALDWIVRNIFHLAPLLDGHSEELVRAAKPGLGWLRQVAIDVDGAGKAGQWLTTTELLESSNAELPGRAESQESPAMQAGKLLGKLFDGRDTCEVDGWIVSRRSEKVHCPTQRKNIDQYQYRVERIGAA